MLTIIFKLNFFEKSVKISIFNFFEKKFQKVSFLIKSEKI